MSQRIAKPSSLVRSFEPLLGFKVPNLHRSGSSYVGYLQVASFETRKPARAPFSDINGKIGIESCLDTGASVGKPTGDVETSALDPDGTALIRRIHVGTHVGEQSDRSEPRLVKEKP